MKMKTEFKRKWPQWHIQCLCQATWKQAGLQPYTEGHFHLLNFSAIFSSTSTYMPRKLLHMKEASLAIIGSKYFNTHFSKDRGLVSQCPVENFTHKHMCTCACTPNLSSIYTYISICTWISTLYVYTYVYTHMYIHTDTCESQFSV